MCCMPKMIRERGKSPNHNERAQLEIRLLLPLSVKEKDNKSSERRLFSQMWKETPRIL